MKQIIKNYSFDKTAGTVTFSDFASISLDRLLLITNVTTNSVIYQFNESTLGGSVSGNVVTLTSPTNAMHDSDKLQIIYDCASGDPLYDASSTASSIQGNVAAGTADSGNPVKVGGKYNASGFTMGDGQRGDLQLDAQGRLKTTPAPLSATIDSVATQGTSTELTGLSAGALNADVVPSTDVGAYKWVSLQITGTFSGTLTFQGSNDNTTFNSVILQRSSDNITGTATNTTATNALWHGPVTYRYLRVRMTAYTSGTANGVLQLYTSPAALTNIQGSVVQQGTWNVGASSPTGSAVPANAFFLGAKNASGNLTGLLDATNGDIASASGVLSALQYVSAPNSALTAQRVRTPDTFKTFPVTASGNTAVWTPAAGKKFRLMRYCIAVTGNAAQSSAGVVTIKFQDGTTDVGLNHSAFVPATAGTTMGSDFNTGWVDLGNGILSAAANNVLNLNLTATLTNGNARVTVAGTEE